MPAGYLQGKTPHQETAGIPPSRANPHYCTTMAACPPKLEKSLQAPRLTSFSAALRGRQQTVRLKRIAVKHHLARGWGETPVESNSSAGGHSAVQSLHPPRADAGATAPTGLNHAEPDQQETNGGTIAGQRPNSIAAACPHARRYARCHQAR